MRPLLVAILLAGLPAAAAITNVRVSDNDRTATQAILRYSAPGPDVCTAAVSESSTYSPLVHDVNPALFGGANRDDRAGNLRNGAERAFVIGKRTAELAADGRYYSRALQQSTAHYFRITCGTDVAAGSFTTAPYALGNTYNEPLPVASAGEYGYPTIDWSEPTTRATAGVTFGSSGTTVTFSGPVPTSDLDVGDMLVINSGPQAGQYRRVSARSDSTHATIAFAGFSSNQPAGTAWLRRTPERTNTQPIIDPLTGFLVRRISGPGNWYRNDYASDGTPRIDRVSGSGWTNATVAAIASADFSVTSFAGGAFCAPDCPWLALHPTSSGVSLSYGDDGKQLTAVMVQVRGSAASSGEDAKIQVCLSADGATCRSAIRELDVSGCASAVCSLGDEWPMLKFWNRTDNVVASYVNRVEFFGPAGAVLVRKKTATGAVNLDYVGLSFGLSDGHGWLTQSYQVCSDVYDTQVYKGVTHTGYRCELSNAFPFYFIDKDSGDSVPTTSHWLAAGSDAGGGWSTGSISTATGSAWDHTDPRAVYGGTAGNRSGGGLVVLKAQYTGANLDMGPYWAPGPPGSYLWNVSTLTKNAPVETKLENFLTGRLPSFQASRWVGRCYASQITDDIYVGGTCWFGQDSSYGWDFLIALTGPNAGEVAAAHSSHSRYPYRFATVHSFPSRRIGDGWMYMGSNDLPASTACGAGPFKTELAEALGAPGGAQNVSCPSPLPTEKTGSACSRVLVSGDLYKPSTVCAWENTNRGDPPSGFLDLQASRVGDVFRLDSEKVQLVGKDSACSDPNAVCYWTLLRAIDSTAGASHSSGAALTAYHPYGANFFDFANDPYGEGGYPDRVVEVYAGHSGPLLNGRLGSVNYTTAACRVPDVPCYAIYSGSLPEIAQQYATNSPPVGAAATQRFGGAIGSPVSSDSHLSYQTRLASETNWMLDAFPPAAPITQTWTYVATSTSLYSTNLTTSKTRPVEGNCMYKPLKDVTPGPIQDGAAGAYTYCLGNCGQGGSATSAYVNCPEARPDATIACGSGGDDLREICLFPTSSMIHTYRQVWVDSRDPFGDTQRNLGFVLGRHRHLNVFMTGITPFDGQWMFVQSRWVDNVRTDAYAVKIGPQPLTDSINRKTFLPVILRVGAVPPGADNVIAEFGYGPEFHCSSRNEVCVTTTTGQVNETTPYYWASEPYTGLPCASGCTLTVPSLSQRVVYYRVKYRRTDGAVVATTATEVATTP